jgi:hypothetical protein
MSLGTKLHTAGNHTRWVLDYAKWLLPQETIASVQVISSSLTMTVDTISTVLGKEVWFFTAGGVAGEQPTVTVSVTTTIPETKIDTVDFLVTSP